MLIRSRTTAILFPGQASHYVGMGRDLYDNFSCVRELFDIASSVAGMNMARLCFEDPENELKLTKYSQPVILTVSVAVAKLIEYHSGVKQYVKASAGHSLGEISALTFSRAFFFADALRLVITRAKAMQRAVPIGQGSMVAIIGLELGKVKQACQGAVKYGVVVPANINAPGQIVIAGHTKAVEHASQLASQAGAKKIVTLDVSAPFHCSLMEPATRDFEQVFKQIKIMATNIPIFRNVDNAPHQGPKEIQEYLVKQLTTPVDWQGMIASLKSSGIQQFIIICPGKVLGGLMRRIDRSLPFFIVEDLASFDELVSQFPK